LIWWRVDTDAKTASVAACADAANGGMEVLGRQLPQAVSESYVKSVFCEWRWSFQVPIEVQRLKFTRENVDHYFHYVMTIAGIPFERLHFLDEFHIVSRDLGCRKVVSPVGRRPFVLAGLDLNTSIHVTMMTNLNQARSPSPILLDFRDGTNSGSDFAVFLMRLVVEGALAEGRSSFSFKSLISRRHSRAGQCRSALYSRALAFAAGLTRTLSDPCDLSPQVLPGAKSS